MFKPTNQNHQANIFHTESFLFGRSLKIYSDPDHWHNQFRTCVVENINEDVFSVLFCDGIGAPNASIRVLVGMMDLKDAFGWSDAQLYEQVLFNPLVRSALGLLNLDDEVPVESTYYSFRKRLVEWEKAGNGDLMEKAFFDLTKIQLKLFDVDGSKVRMDSFLMSSNIAWNNRYELIHTTLKSAWKENNFAIVKHLIDSEIKYLYELSKENCEKISYRSNKEDLETRISQMGVIIHKIVNIPELPSTPSIDVLRQVFDDQYEVIDGVVTPLPKQKIKATSVQSPHDPDCDYREKGEQKVKGYSINVTETCHPENNVNLITSVIVKPASAADCDYLIPAIEATEKLTNQAVKSVNTDGAYHSPENQTFCQEKDCDLIIGKMQGNHARYDLTMNENGELIVTDLLTSEIIPSQKTKPKTPDKPPTWRIIDHNGKPRYFDQKEIDNCYLRKKLKTRTQEELNLRNNVEATIFQLGYHYPHKKSRYRGLVKHGIWAFVRCIWINFVRISKYLKSLATKGGKMVAEIIKPTIFIFLLIKFVILNVFLPNLDRKLAVQ